MNYIEYVLVSSPRSLCPCRQKLVLLCPKDQKTDASEIAKDPLFWICWNCKRVFQTGVGEVRFADESCLLTEGRKA